MFTLFLAILLILFLAAPVWAAEKSITFGWTQEISADFAGWKLYSATAPGVAVNPTNLVATIDYTGTVEPEYTSAETVLSPDGQEVLHYFVLTAFDQDGNESGPSNEVSKMIDFLAPGVPIQFKIKMVTGN